MDLLTKCKYNIESLCIYRLKDDEVIAALYDMLVSVRTESVVQKQSEFFSALAPCDSLKRYVSEKILCNDNIFTRAAAAGKADTLPDHLLRAAEHDLMKLEEIASLTAEDILAESEGDVREILLGMPSWQTGSGVPPLEHQWCGKLQELKQFHQIHGYGVFSEYPAFSWKNGALVPITSLDPVRLNDLKNYQTQKGQAVENTVSFLKGYPANNVLLYGDRGTGKSSTVHAILNEYAEQGLRMIEISKGDISDLTAIREKIADCPMKFIIFIDDLSFDSRSDVFGELKASLEGSRSGRQNNTLIYATSNRRHLIKENFSDREDDMHRSDTMQEELSLSDRFGLSIYFMNPDKADYLEIAYRIAEDRGLEVGRKTFEESAARWARRLRGRYPRFDRQFVDDMESKIRQGRQG